MYKEKKKLIDLPFFYDKKALDVPYKGGIYLDIETRGFSSKRHQIYALGLIFLEKGEWIFQQYLCINENDEYELLFSFNEQIKEMNFPPLIHYNGQSFDLPFIKHRMKLYGISENLSQCQSIDFYKFLQPYRTFLPFENLKLKTIEKASGFNRKDPYDGGQLIDLYQRFLDGEENLLPTIALHNQEDLLGLFGLNCFYFFYLLQDTNLQLRGFNDIKTSYSIVREKPILSLYGNFPSIPYTYHFTHPTPFGHLEVKDGGWKLDLPCVQGQLYYFFDDYKDYYYLPVEDYAIHKSVAQYVDSEFRKKASRSNAYIKKEGIFIQCPLSLKEIKKYDKTYIQKNQIPIKLFQRVYEDTCIFIRIENDQVSIPKHWFPKILDAFIKIQ